MATQYPIIIDSELTLPKVTNSFSSVNADSVNRLRDAIVAIETELGVKPSSLFGTVKARLDSLETFTGGGAAAGDLSGTYPNPTVIKIRTRSISSTAPTDGQVLTWVNSESNWKPVNPPSSPPGGSTTQVQFNDGGVFGGDAGLTYDKTNNILNISDALTFGSSALSTIGHLRFPSANQNFISARSSGGVNMVAVGASAIDELFVAGDKDGSNRWSNVYIRPTSNIFLGTAVTNSVKITTNKIEITDPTTTPLIFGVSQLPTIGAIRVRTAHAAPAIAFRNGADTSDISALHWFNDIIYLGSDHGGGRTASVVTIHSPLALSATLPAAAGQLRLPNNTSINFRNAANTADFEMIKSDGANQTTLGGLNIILNPAGSVQIPTGIPLIIDGSAGAAQSGSIRLNKASVIKRRNFDNTVDETILEGDGTSSQVFIGSKINNTEHVSTLVFNTNSSINLYHNGVVRLSTDGNGTNISTARLQLADTIPLNVGATNPASAGDIRGRNNRTILAMRNAANSNDIYGISTDASDNINIGATPAGALGALNNTVIYAANTVITAIGAASKFTVSSTLSRSLQPFALGAATPASTGDFRLPNTFNFSRRNGTNTADETIFASTTDTLSIAGPATGTSGQYFSNVVVNAFGTFSVSINGANRFQVDANAISIPSATITSSTLQFNSGTRLTMGSQPASTGDISVSTGFTFKARNAGNTANILFGQFDTSNYLWIGDNAANTESTNRTHLRANNVVLLGVQGSDYFYLDSQEEMHRDPILGFDTHSSPFGVHGGTAHTFAADANYVVTAAQYKYDWLEFITGSWTIGRTVTFPHPTSKIRGYYKTIFNNTSFTMTISTGTGTTRTLTTLLAQRFWFDNGGVTFAGGTFTP